jgi:DNA-binding response OmpR family regulator
MQAKKHDWKNPYPKARYRIFFVDDLPYWVRKVRETLSAAGYTVFTANNREDALALLSETHIHLGIFDVNLSHAEESPEDSEPVNRDGLDLAAEIQFPKVRLIFTVYNNVEWIKFSFYGAHVAEYVIKENDMVLGLLEKVENALQEHLTINYDLAIYWKNASLQELVSRLSPELDLEAQFERMMEINDLLRMQFYKDGNNQFYKQISLEILEVEKRQQLWLKVQAYTFDGENRQFLLLCGEQAVMHSPPLQADMLRAIDDERCAKTVHYRFIVYEVNDGSLGKLDSLAQHWRRGDSDLVGDSLKKIFQWWHLLYIKKKGSLEEGSLGDLALGMKEAFSEAKLRKLNRIVMRISQEWEHYSPDNPISLKEDKLYFGESQIYLNPALLLDKLSRKEVRRKVGEVHGDFTLGTIVARESDAELIWMPKDIPNTSLLRDYVSLERSLHLLELSQLNLYEYESLAHFLNEYENDTAVDAFSPQTQAAARLIQGIRHFAIKELECTLEDYLEDLLMDFMDYLGTYPQQDFPPYEVVKQYSHCLLFAAQLCQDVWGSSDDLPSPFTEEKGIILDPEQGKVKVWGISVQLSNKHYLILAYMLGRLDENCTYQEIIEEGLKEKALPDIDDDKPSIQTAISRIRKDIHPLGLIIETTKTGYRLKKS